MAKRNVKTPESDIWDGELFAEIEKILAKLTAPRQRRYVEHYCRYLSKTAAAKYAGYSERNASRVGWAIHSLPHVRGAVTEFLMLVSCRPEDYVSAIRRISDINLAVYFTLETYWEEKKISVPLDVVIEKLKAERDIEEDILLESGHLRPAEKAEMFNNMKMLEARIMRLEKRLARFPNEKIFDYEPILRSRKVLNMDKVIADNVPIKSVKYKETGIEVEFYSVLDARDKIARIDGSFEKDNLQNRPVVNNNLTAERVKEISDKLDNAC